MGTPRREATRAATQADILLLAATLHRVTRRSRAIHHRATHLSLATRPPLVHLCPMATRHSRATHPLHQGMERRRPMVPTHPRPMVPHLQAPTLLHTATTAVPAPWRLAPLQAT